jgi:hypothetical protein
VSAHSRDAWQLVGDAVLRGINHALANRVTALAALTASAFPDEPPGAELVDALALEVERLEELLRLLRLLPAGRDGGGAELVLVADALADAEALHAHHTGLAESLCDVQGDRAALLPVVAPIPGLVQALVLLLGAVGMAHRGGGRPVVRLTGSERFVRLAGAADGGSAAVVAGLERLLEGAGAAVRLHEGGELVVELPTLVEVRARAGR